MIIEDRKNGLSSTGVVQNLVLEEKISMGHARCLSKLEDDMKIFEIADRIMQLCGKM